MSLVRCSLVLVSVLMAGRVAVAASDGSEILIREGVELRKAGNNAAALAKFARAYQVSHSPRAAAQLGLCEHALGQWLEADQHLAEALTAVSDPWVLSHRATLEASVAAVRKELGTIRVQGKPDGASVVVNDVLAAQLPEVTSVRVKPGKVRVTVSAPGYEPFEAAYDVAAGATRDVSVNLNAIVVAKPAAPASATAALEPRPAVPTAANMGDVEASAVQEPPSSLLYKVGVGTAALAGVSLVMGVVSHVGRELRANDFNAEALDCDRTAGVVTGAPACAGLARDFDDHNKRMWLGYAGAALLGAGGATMMWFGRDRGGAAQHACSLTTTGVTCMGRF